MKLHLSASAVMIGLCLGFQASPEAQAASFTFTKIADTSGIFSSFDETPALNNAGTVAFFAELDAGGEGIFTVNGATITTIAQTGDRFSSLFDPPSINDSGTVAFTANLDPRVRGIFTSNGTTTTTIAIRDNSMYNADYFLVGSPSINNVGTVAYSVGGITGGVGIGNGTPDDREPDVDRLFNYGPPAINDAGRVAVLNASRFLKPTIFINSETFFRGNVGNPSINNQGVIAFYYENKILTFKETTTIIADSRSAFNRFFGTPSINDLGTVAFLAELDTGGTGIFTGKNPVNDKVIASGDTFFDSTVTNLGFYREGLNNSGQLAFFASLADGTSGIFRADPIVVEPPKDVPEPASVLGLLAFGVWSATSALKRKQKQLS